MPPPRPRGAPAAGGGGAPAAGGGGVAAASVHIGRVLSFDTERGAGEIEDGDGRRYPFHCTRVTDGTRLVAVGAAVHFRLAAGLPGRWEAIEIVKR